MAGMLIGGILMVTIGGVMLGIGIYLTAVLFGSLNASGLPPNAQSAYNQSQTYIYTAFKILGVALIVAGFAVIIGTLLSMGGS